MRFATDGELRSFLQCQSKALEAREQDSEVSGTPLAGATLESAQTSDSASNGSITNNQVRGADEGDIVKSIGSWLLVLRQGRVYALSIAESGAPRLTDSLSLPLDAALAHDAWYDEMLVSGNRLFVIGYRYYVPGTDAHGATEVHSLRLDAGKLTRVRTVFFESDDYYSGRNYASRLVDGKVVLYQPHGIFASRSDDWTTRIPTYLTYENGSFKRGRALFRGSDVFRPLTEGSRAWAFHTMLTCTPTDTDLPCSARAVIGGHAREHFVSARNTYVVLDGAVVQMALSGESITAHAMTGETPDQFAMHESESDLELVVNDPRGATGVHVLLLPLAAFGARAGQPVVQRRLSDGRAMTARRLEDRWLIAVSPGGDGGFFCTSCSVNGEFELVAHEVAAVRTARLTVPSSTFQRLEPLSTVGALLVTGSSSSTPELRLRTLRFDDSGAPVVAGTATLSGASQGEWRSHAFFLAPRNGGVRMGLPVLNDVSTKSQGLGFGSGVANIAFFGVDGGGAITANGITASRATTASSCEASCTDWYGNTRPIFLGDRIFALMGGELQEVAWGKPVAAAGPSLSFGP